MTSIITLAAFLTAMLSSIIGMAGGMVFLAILLLFFAPAEAIPLHACVQLVSNGSRVLMHVPQIQWRVCGYFCVPAVLGIFGGRQLFLWMEAANLQMVIAIFVLVFTHIPKPRKGHAWPQWVFSIAGLLTGTVGMLVGATGPIIAPFFLHTHILKEELIATKAACQMAVHLLKIIAFGTLGFAFRDQVGMIALLGTAVVAGTWCGKQVLGYISERAFVIFYKCVLTLVAMYLLIGAW